MIIFTFNSSEQSPASLCEYQVKFQDDINDLFKIGHIVVQKNWIYYPVCYKPIITHSKETDCSFQSCAPRSGCSVVFQKSKFFAYKNFLNLLKYKNIAKFLQNTIKLQYRLFLSMGSS